MIYSYIKKKCVTLQVLWRAVDLSAPVHGRLAEYIAMTNI